MSNFTFINPINHNYGEDEDDDSQEENNEDTEHFILYRDRPEWSDLKPVVQDDGPYNVASIRYSVKYEDTYNYFRGVLAVQEFSERAFLLTEDCIKLNASNYTVWHYRRILLEKLNKDLLDELIYINKTIWKNPKNYQVWEHQKFLLKKIKEKIIQNEIKDVNLDHITITFKSFINEILNQNDAKNYHAWQQHQWFIKDWNRFDDELEFSNKMIEDDIRNNSAWNHRFYVIKNTTGFTEDIICRECHYAIMKIKLIASHNESNWNYLIGVIKQSSKDIDSFQWLMDICDHLYKNVNDETRSPYLVDFMLRFLCFKLDKMMMNNESKNDYFKYLYEKAKAYCQELANKIDPIRKHYWDYQAAQLEKIYAV